MSDKKSGLYGKINVRGIDFDNVNYNEALGMCMDFVRNPKSSCSAVLHTPNSEILQLCIEHNEYYEIIGSADIIICAFSRLQEV